MKTADPREIFINANLILDQVGNWPNFHDAEILDLQLWRGDVQPSLNRYIGPQITLKIALCALPSPYIVTLHFEDCESIKLLGFGLQNPILDLEIGLEARGTLLDGTPMSPYICVNFRPVGPFTLSFKCFNASVLNVEPLSDPNCCL